MQTPTGSSFARKVCHTVTEIEANREQGRKLLDEAGRIQDLQQQTAITRPR